MSYWLFYNIFRLESFLTGIFHYPAYVLFERPVISNIVETKDHNETFRIRITDLLKSRKGITASRLVSLTAILFLVTPWNLFLGFFQIQNQTVWFGGWICASVIALIITVKADNPDRHLKDFEKNELKTQKEFRRSAFIAFLIMIGIWSISILGFVYFLNRSKG